MTISHSNPGYPEYLPLVALGKDEDIFVILEFWNDYIKTDSTISVGYKTNMLVFKHYIESTCEPYITDTE